MSSYIVIASTSVVLINSASLTSGQSAVVLLSSQMPPGRNVTVRDSVGYLSSPQYLVVSTTNGILFSDGTSSIRVSEPYASLSFTSRDANTWNIINTFGFPLYNTIANVQSLTASTLTGATLTVQGSLSASQIRGNSLLFQSTSQILGTAFISSLVVGAQPPFSGAGYAAYILGSSYISSNVVIGGNLSIQGASYFQSSMTIAGTLGVTQGVTTGGDLTVQGNFQTIGPGALIAQSGTFHSSLTILGPAIFNSNVTIQSNVTVGGTTTLAAMTASTIQVASGGYLQLGTGPILRARNDILPGQTVAAWNSPLYTPFLSTQTIQNTGYTYLQNLTVTSTISAPTLQQFLLGSTLIFNPSGSLITSNVTTNSLTLSNTLSIGPLITSSIQVSSATVRDAITMTSPFAYLSSGIIYTSTLNVAQISTGTILAGVIQTPSVRVSSLTVAQTIDGGTSLTSFTMPSTTINNSQGRFTTAAMNTSSLTTSTLFLQSGVIQSSSNITINAQSVFMNSANINNLTDSTIQSSTIQTTRMIVGAPTTAVYPDFTLLSSSNAVVSGGPGNYLTPYYLSNAIPSGQNPAVAYTSFASFTADYKTSPPPPGLVIGYTATLYWGGQSASYVAIAGGPTLYGTYGSDQSASGILSQSTFQVTGTLFGASSYNVSYSFQYSPNVNSIDSNAVIEFNNGILRWNYALNGTTIQNSLNDIATRNLYYYGSLNFASDPRIKEDVQDADLKRCYDTVAALPLRRYKYIDSYCSTFQVADSHRLGFLATDLLPHFPKSVHTSDSIFPEFSTSLLTIDTSQVEMAHIGATKYLMQEVERLEAQLAALNFGATR